MKDRRFGTEHVVEKWGKRAHARRVLTLVAGSSRGGGGVTCAGIGNAGTSIMMFKNQLSQQQGLPTPNAQRYRTGPGVHTAQPGALLVQFSEPKSQRFDGPGTAHTHGRQLL